MGFQIHITQGGSPCGEEIGFTMFYQIIMMGMFYVYFLFYLNIELFILCI